MTSPTTSHTYLSYPSFTRELELLLKEKGVSYSRQVITAGANRKESRIGVDHEVQTTIGRVIIYMENHLTDNLSLDELAGEVGLSKYQLIRGFREEKETTPWKFLIEKRIEKVKNLLENGVHPGEAAAEAGFYDQSHMNKAFAETMGCTPKEYQERAFKNKN